MPKPRVDEDARPVALDEHRVAAAAAAEHPDLHSLRSTVQRASCDGGELPPRTLAQRDVPPRHHALRHLEELVDVGTARYGGRARPTRTAATTLGGIGCRTRSAPAPSTRARRQPQADAGLHVIAEHRAEELHARVAHAVAASRACTVPYVFFRLLVIVPAPRFTQRPRYEWPTKPSCPLFEWPTTIVLLISPCTLQRSPIEQPATSIAERRSRRAPM